MRIGIDLGGSHIAVGLVEGEKLLEIEEHIFTHEEKQDFETSIIDYIHQLVEIILKRQDISIENIEKMGIASPGTISNGKIVKAGNLGLENFEMVAKLKEKYPIAIQIRNDGKCAALAEKNFGAMKAYDDCLFVNIGTGIGGAVFLNGKLLEPKMFSGFELGHMVIHKNGNLCTCGKKGCFETYCSIKALKKRITNTLGIENINISGQYLREELMVKYHDKLQEDIQTYIDDLVIGIGNLIDIFEPEVICFGGSFSYYEGNPLLEQFIEKMNAPKMTFNDNCKRKIVTAQLKNDAGLIGATLDN